MSNRLYLYRAVNKNEFLTSEYFDIRKASPDGHRYQLQSNYWCGAYYYNAKQFIVDDFYWVNNKTYCKCIEITDGRVTMRVIDP